MSSRVVETAREMIKVAEAEGGRPTWAWKSLTNALIREIETLEMLLPVAGSITFPPGCAEYAAALRLSQETKDDG